MSLDYRKLDDHLKITRSYAFSEEIEGTFRGVCANPPDWHRRTRHSTEKGTVKALGTCYQWEGGSECSRISIFKIKNCDRKFPGKLEERPYLARKLEKKTDNRIDTTRTSQEKRKKTREKLVTGADRKKGGFSGIS